MTLSCRAFLASTAITSGAAAWPVHFVGGRSAPSGYTATLTLVNHAPSTATVAGVPTRLFGWSFAPGAIPSGQRPVFTEC
jgi:hypothetical protein